MIYKFKSKATGDRIMLEPNGDTLLRVLGREPDPKGIIEPQAMAAAIAAIEQAVAAEEAARDAADQRDASDAGGQHKRDGVSLRQRLWPMVEMLKRAMAAGEPVVWGV